MRSPLGAFFVRLAKRLGWAAITLLGTIVVTYTLIYAVPADPARMVAGAKADPETIKNISHQLRLDRPAPVRFALYVNDLAHGNWGKSSFTRKGVLPSIWDRFPATLELAGAGLFFYLVIGIPLGVWTARHNNGWQDRTVLIVGMCIISMPIFYLARMLQYGAAYKAQWLPVAGIGGLGHLLLPAFVLGLAGGVYYSRLLHSSLVEVFQQDYMRFSRARGLPERRVLWRHGVRNALIPVCTQLGMDVAGLLGGVIFT
ncbi:MAG: ABC transporter permease, partial [Armatimonadota bacterium]|nr:ABC transporter permease [Armatimonadota bacterium]